MNETKPFEIDKRLIYEAYKKVKSNKAYEIWGSPKGQSLVLFLANLFLHYVFDRWMQIYYPHIPFERYADDTICHCRTEQESECLKKAITVRFSACRLMLNEEKKKIVYCGSMLPKSCTINTSFDFLGFTFRYRLCMNSKTKMLFVTFSPAISRKASMKLRESIRSWNLTSKVYMNIKSLASLLNPQIQGWINYYAKFNKTEFRKVMVYLNEKLARWLRRKYKKLRNGYVAKAIYALSLTARKNPTLFAHWAHGYTLYAKRSNYQ